VKNPRREIIADAGEIWAEDIDFKSSCSRLAENMKTG
jgi:hypothetical protein